ncbi:hypothetical protein EFL77_08485 [Pediococcus pentosaceus]|uniref:single-stranded DNA-binding protein n=1 Tax=Pediococcus pentosaceus TaxID=1255 RepID=UPI0021AEC6D2|nr:single-stranded DNA-binding protein [Pediococcus pentosaceus]MCT1178532.1 hypothetical protein [Pediococcus pentosaceus]
MTQDFMDVHVAKSHCGEYFSINTIGEIIEVPEHIYSNKNGDNASIISFTIASKVNSKRLSRVLNVSEEDLINSNASEPTTFIRVHFWNNEKLTNLLIKHPNLLSVGSKILVSGSVKFESHKLQEDSDPYYYGSYFFTKMQTNGFANGIEINAHQFDIL